MNSGVRGFRLDRCCTSFFISISSRPAHATAIRVKAYPPHSVLIVGGRIGRSRSAINGGSKLGQPAGLSRNLLDLADYREKTCWVPRPLAI